jgi:hypothetical protein
VQDALQQKQTKQSQILDRLFDYFSKRLMISGINGGNCILSSMAKERVKSNIINQAQIVGKKGEYTVVFNGSEWDGIKNT